MQPIKIFLYQKRYNKIFKIYRFLTVIVLGKVKSILWISGLVAANVIPVMKYQWSYDEMLRIW